MNKFCIILNTGNCYSSFHKHVYKKPEEFSKKTAEIISVYFLSLEKDYRVKDNDVCKSIYSFEYENKKFFVLLRLKDKHPSIFTHEGLLFYDEINKKEFFDELFRK